MHKVVRYVVTEAKILYYTDRLLAFDMPADAAAFLLRIARRREWGNGRR